MVTLRIKKCPACGAYPVRESYIYNDKEIYLWACPNDCLVPEELKENNHEAISEWNQCVGEAIEISKKN